MGPAHRVPTAQRSQHCHLPRTESEYWWGNQGVKKQHKSKVCRLFIAPMQMGPGPQAPKEGHWLSLVLLRRATEVVRADTPPQSSTGTSSLEPAEASQPFPSHQWVLDLYSPASPARSTGSPMKQGAEHQTESEDLGVSLSTLTYKKHHPSLRPTHTRFTSSQH